MKDLHKTPASPFEDASGVGTERLPRKVLFARDVRADLYLHAGQILVSESPVRIMTILGSCVSVCLWAPGGGVGGVNHFLLPHFTRNGDGEARFGNVAMEMLLNKMVSAGCRPRSLQAKIFGGAKVLGSGADDGGHLGAENVRLARDFLKEKGVAIAAEDVGGTRGRKIVFDTGIGVVWVQLIEGVR